MTKWRWSEFQVPWCKYYQQSVLNQPCWSYNQESTLKPIFSEKIKDVASNDYSGEYKVSYRDILQLGLAAICRRRQEIAQICGCTSVCLAHTILFPIPTLSPSTLSILHTVSGKEPTYSRIVFTLVIPSSLIISHQAVDTEAGKHVAPGPGIVSPPLLPDHWMVLPC